MLYCFVLSVRGAIYCGPRATDRLKFPPSTRCTAMKAEVARRILEPLLGGPRHFRELERESGVSSRTLSKYLREMEELGLVATVKTGYYRYVAITKAGVEFLERARIAPPALSPSSPPLSRG